ncbi:MAG: phosphatidylglycerol lysyltransferase domain-containing protein [Burkholderiales bacterium]|nr:phosphatidylglycerol lysyltransferase domain-containing protein [Burkholderiales bacterium]
MIPKFPEFKHLELNDKDEVIKFTKKFPPYSDFNFVSMWSWDIHNKMMISELNGNLVVLFSDYITEKHFLSFIGENKISDTALELISFSEKKYGSNFLKLIPEEVMNVLKKEIFKLDGDRDSYDYIYSIANLSNMNNWSQNTSGKGIRRFIKSNPSYTVKQFSGEDAPKNELKKMFKEWAENKNIDDHFELNEYKAFERLLEIKDPNIKFLCLYLGDILSGFTVYEILSNDFVISHFAKANKKHNRAISDVLNWEEAKILNKKGIKYYNWEQDLGMSGLRYSKEKYKHSFFLKKFVVSKLS